MIKGNVGKVTINEDNGLIADEKFFVESFPLEDNMNGLAVGFVLKWNADKTKLSFQDNYTDEPFAILCENIEGKTNKTHARCLVFGRVNLNALTIGGARVANGAPEDKRTIIESLRKIGIYATEGEK